MIKKRGFLAKIWEREKFTIGIIVGMGLMIMILVISLFVAMVNLSVVGGC